MWTLDCFPKYITWSIKIKTVIACKHKVQTQNIGVYYKIVCVCAHLFNVLNSHDFNFVNFIKEKQPCLKQIL